MKSSDPSETREIARSVVVGSRTHFPTNGGPLEFGGRSVMVSSTANFSPLNTHESTFLPLGAGGAIFVSTDG